MNQIFFVTNELSGGGAERVMSVLANYLCEAGHQVKFLVLKKISQEYPLNDSIEKIIWDKHKTGDAIGQVRFIRRHMRDNPHATFVSFFTHQNLYTILASIGLDVKVVVSERNDPEHSINGGFKKFIRKKLYASSLCDTIVFQTNGAKGYFDVRIQKKGVIIPNPLKEGLPEPYKGEREKSIVSFGRFEPQKNYELLIKAFASFVKSHGDFVLKLYGQGSLESNLRELAERLDIADKVLFMGFDKSVHEKIVKAGMFVLPSNYEGLSNSMLEAMAVGLPVICTDCPPGGAREYIESGVNGVLVATDDKECMTKAMFYIVDNPDNATAMGMNASMVRYELSAKKICAAWESYLR